MTTSIVRSQLLITTALVSTCGPHFPLSPTYAGQVERGLLMVRDFLAPLVGAATERRLQ